MANSEVENVDGAAAERLRSFIKRLENLEDEKSEIQGHLKDVLSEAKGEGFDTKIIKTVMRIRKMKPEERQEFENLTELYLSALEAA